MQNIKWKGEGQTFNQLVSSIRLNKRNEPSVNNIFNALPAQHYRHEIVSASGSIGKASVDEMLRPSGAIKTTNNSVGICTYLNINPSNNSCEYPSSTNCFTNVSGKDDDARKLVRSAGNVKHLGKASPIASNYQYLVSRRRTFDQSQYNHPTTTPNVFRPNGICDTQCSPSIYHNPSNTKFQVQGGVTSSSRIERLKLDTIKKTANQSKNSAAPTTANTIVFNPHTMKERMYPCPLQKCL